MDFRRFGDREGKREKPIPFIAPGGHSPNTVVKAPGFTTLDPAHGALLVEGILRGASTAFWRAFSKDIKANSLLDSNGEDEGIQSRSQCFKTKQNNPPTMSSLPSMQANGKLSPIHHPSKDSGPEV